jgi:hypothetical protein
LRKRGKKVVKDSWSVTGTGIWKSKERGGRRYEEDERRKEKMGRGRMRRSGILEGAETEG